MVQSWMVFGCPGVSEEGTCVNVKINGMVNLTIFKGIAQITPFFPLFCKTTYLHLWQ